MSSVRCPSTDPILLDFIESHYFPRRPGLKPDSRSSIRYTLRKFGEHLGRPARSCDLAPPYLLVAQFVASVVAKGLAAATVNLHLRNLHALVNELHRQRFVKRRLSVFPEPMRELKRKPRCFTTEQVAFLVADCVNLVRLIKYRVPMGVYVKALVLAFYDTAGRAKALHRVRREDIDLDRGLLVLRAEEGKDGEDIDCWLKPATVEALRELLALADGQLFDFVSRSWMLKMLRRAFDRVNMPSVRRRKDLSHKLRRTSLTYLCKEKGLDAARQKAGHSTAQLTLDFYIDETIAFDSAGWVNALPDVAPAIATRPELRVFAG